MELKVGKRYKIESVVVLQRQDSIGTCECVDKDGNELYVHQSALLPYVEKIEYGDLVRWESEDGLQIVQGIVEEIEDYDDESSVILCLSVGESNALMPMDECTIIKKKAELSK